jgi:hypothetical protein
MAAMRRPRDEAQWTQVIAATADGDPVFAGQLAALLVSSAPNVAAVAALGEVPGELGCLAEHQLTAVDGRDLGRVDLVFRDADGQFCLFVEQKLHSSYGIDQLPRYVAALEAEPAERKALVAVTTTRPLAGEDAVGGVPGWLGSLRWRSLYDGLHQLVATEPGAKAGWRAVLTVLRQQGDFGPMDFDPAAISAWARRDEAEKLLRYFLGEIATPTLGIARAAVGNSADDESAAAMLMRGQSKTQPIVPWRNRLHVAYSVPTLVGEPRLRVQFVAFDDGKPYFTVEARYEHPKESIADVPSVCVATDAVRKEGLATGSDLNGHYWAGVFPTDAWLAGPETVDLLLGLSERTIGTLAQAGIFSALAELTPQTPSAEPATDSEDE